MLNIAILFFMLKYDIIIILYKLHKEVIYMTERTKSNMNLAVKLLIWRILLLASTTLFFLTLMSVSFEADLLENIAIRVILGVEFLFTCFAGTMQGFVVEAIKSMK